MKLSTVYSLMGYVGIAGAVTSAAGTIMYYNILESQQNGSQPQVEIPRSMNNHIVMSGIFSVVLSSYGFLMVSQAKKEEQKKGLENKLNEKGEQ